MKTDQEIFSDVQEKYGDNYLIKKIWGTTVELRWLRDNESVCFGDGKTYYFLLTKINKMEQILLNHVLRLETKVDILIDNLYKVLAHMDKEGSQLSNILKNQKNMANTLDEVLADVEAESTQIDGLTTLTGGLKQQLADALSGANLPPAVQAKVDAVFAGVEANKQKVIDAINANTSTAT